MRLSSSNRETGLAVTIIGLFFMISIFLIPFNVAWSKYGDSSITIHVYKYADPPESWSGTDNQAGGAWVNIEPTVAGAHLVDVFGKVPPTTTDTYGIMSWYCDIGVYKWTVKYDGKQLVGYVQTEQDVTSRINVYVYDGKVNYNPPEHEYTGEPPETTPTETTEGDKTVLVTTTPETGLRVVVIGMGGNVYVSHVETPVQFTVTKPSDFIEVIWVDNLEGYTTPETWRGTITTDTKIVGKYLRPENEGEEDSETEVIAYPDETEASSTQEEPSEKGEKQTYIDRKIDKLKTDLVYQLIFGMGALTALFGIFLVVKP